MRLGHAPRSWMLPAGGLFLARASTPQLELLTGWATKSVRLFGHVDHECLALGGGMVVSSHVTSKEVARLGRKDAPLLPGNWHLAVNFLV